MTKAINFTAIEVLPSLLDKSKTQTIRPAWKEIPIKKDIATHIPPTRNSIIRGTYGKDNWITLINKPPRFKVGDKVRLMWTGNIHNLYGKSPITPCLGTVEITEVFKIEMRQSGEDLEVKSYRVYFIGKKLDAHYCFDKKCHGSDAIIDLAKRDGFRDGVIPINEGVMGRYSPETAAEQMFKYFDKNYDLSSSKQFYVYRFKWQKQSQKEN